jgi:hypothetical protein
LCLLEDGGTERLVGFEVKAVSDHEKGIVQATRYRIGVHEAYLCVADLGTAPQPWLLDSARQNGVGLALASQQGIDIRVEPATLRPDPAILLDTRRYLLGESNVRALGLNKPLHYVAVLAALRLSNDPVRVLTDDWGLKGSAIRHAYRGAETLGLIRGSQVTPKGEAYADTLSALDFDLKRDRYLTARRLVDQVPGYAALLRAVLLDNPAVQFIVQVLDACGTGPVTADKLAARAHVMEGGMARAVFGGSPGPGESWRIRPSTRFNLKAALYDVGLLSSPLAHGAGSSDEHGGYSASADIWCMERGAPIP